VLAGAKAVVVITGSIYLVGEVMQSIGRTFSTAPCGGFP
jgi:folylpolyglutamate synthase/dihydropteroate synthase